LKELVKKKVGIIEKMKESEFVLLGVGAVAGAFLRYKITSSPILLGILPVNVLIVNVVGSFVLGSFSILATSWNLDAKYSLLVAIGFCGSLTTMSSFALETSRLLDERAYASAALSILANVGLSIGAIIGARSLMIVIVEGGLR
jgi:fluoride exporter